MVGEKDLISVPLGQERENDSILVRVDPTSEMSMISLVPLCTVTVVITRKDSSTVQRSGLHLDRSVPGDDIVPEETSYVCTVKVPRPSESIVQIVPPFNDHTSEIFPVLHLISLATPPVWISQITMAISEAQAIERPSGE